MVSLQRNNKKSLAMTNSNVAKKKKKMQSNPVDNQFHYLLMTWLMLKNVCWLPPNNIKYTHVFFIFANACWQPPNNIPILFRVNEFIMQMNPHNQACRLINLVFFVCQKIRNIMLQIMYSTIIVCFKTSASNNFATDFSWNRVNSWSLSQGFKA